MGHSPWSRKDTTEQLILSLPLPLYDAVLKLEHISDPPKCLFKLILMGHMLVVFLKKIYYIFTYLLHRVSAAACGI